MASDPRLDASLRAALRAWLDPASGPHPVWEESPAEHRLGARSATRTRRASWLILAAAAVLLLSIGSLAAAGGWLPRLPGVVPAPSPSASGCQGCTPTPTPSEGATPTAATSPPLPSPSPAPSPTVTLATCPREPRVVLGDATVPVNVSDVRVGGDIGIDRIVFYIDGALLPTLEVSPVTPPFTLDPSGLPLTVQGTAFLRLVLRNAQGQGLPLAELDQRTPGFPQLDELRLQGDSEGIISWLVGLRASTCYSVTTLSAPTRIVVNLYHP